MTDITQVLHQLYEEFGYLVMAVHTSRRPGEILLPNECNDGRDVGTALFITGYSNLEEAIPQAHRACEILGISPEINTIRWDHAYMRVQPLD